MKRQVTWLFVVIGIVGIVSWTVLAQTQTETKAVWEYKAISYPHPVQEGPLNQLGKDGWELVAVNPACPNDSACTFYAYLKRRR